MFQDQVFHLEFLVELRFPGPQSKSETLEEISVVEAWLKGHPWVSHFVPNLVVVQDRLKRLRNPPAPATDLDAGSRLALGGSRSLQSVSAMEGRCRKPSPLQPAQRNQPPASSADRYMGGPLGLWGTPQHQKASGVGGERWRWGIHSRSLSLQKHAHRHQPPPAPTGPKPDPVPAPHQRLPVVAHSPTSEVLTVASAQVPTPRRSLPSDVSRSPTSVVLTAASAPVPAPRRRFQPDIPCVSTSEVPAAPAPVPAPHQRLPAGVSPLQASEVLAAPAPGPTRAGGSWLTSPVFRLQRSSRCQLRFLPLVRGRCRSSCPLPLTGLRTTRLRSSRA